MKYVVVQGDGMADKPLEELSGRTPLEAANTPNMDEVADCGKLGLVETIPSPLPPGSSVGNISLMGLDPEKYYTGRAPLEAEGQGLEIEESDLVFRCNLVKFGENGGIRVMEDYSGGHPTDLEAEKGIDALKEELEGSHFRLYQGVSYRNLLVWKGGRNEVDWEELELTPPHDITGMKTEEYLPRGGGSEVLRDLQDLGRNVLRRNGDGFNGIWLWGAGVRPEIPTLQERYGLDGAVISAVDLIKGIGSYAGLEPLEIEGATGFIDTNYEGKVRAALEHLDEGGMVFLHVEAPDEASHMGDLQLKLEAIEKVDRNVVAPIREALEAETAARMMVLTDHLTSIESGTHERGSVPFAFSGAGVEDSTNEGGFSEREAEKRKLNLPGGPELMDLFLSVEG
ncbi:MAG: cofactor-independent phosphoglycerate mutase [Candidatus Acetothermia bacterium]